MSDFRDMVSEVESTQAVALPPGRPVVLLPPGWTIVDLKDWITVQPEAPANDAEPEPEPIYGS